MQSTEMCIEGHALITALDAQPVAFACSNYIIINAVLTNTLDMQAPFVAVAYRHRN